MPSSGIGTGLSVSVFELSLENDMNAGPFRSDLARRLFWTMTFSTALFGCGGGDPAPAPAGDSVTLDAGHAASAAIGPDGGQIVATSSGGVSYSLSIPKGALDR